MTEDSNAGERNTPKMDAELPAAESQETAPKTLSAEEQEMADGHRYQSDEFRAAREGGKPGGDRKKFGAKDGKPGAKGDKKPGKDGAKFSKEPVKTERIAKTLARAGLASRREVERLIGLGKIAVNGRILETPAVLVSNADVITVEGQVIGKAEATRLWRYHKPVGLVTTHRDPQGRPTVFDKLPEPLPRVISVGRLDLNSEGLLLLTNDGELARALELPSTGWMRRYRARALGHTTQAKLDALKHGTTVEGVIYGPIEATLDKMVDKPDGRANVWITVGITEGKNREVRKVLESIGLKVNRLIRLAYGPFQLGNLEPGDVEEVGPRVIRELLSDMIDPRNMPVEGASQTQDRPAARSGSRFSRDKTGGDDSRSTERRGGANRFAETGDRPRSDNRFGAKKAFPEKREYKPRDFDERPRFEGDGEARDRRPEGEAPRRSYDKKPFGDSSFKDRPRFDRSASGEGGGERKSYAKPRSDAGGDRPRPSYGDKPRFDRGASGESGGERKSYGKPRSDAGGDRPRPSYGDKPRFDRGASGEGGGERKSYGKPRSDAGGDRPRPSYGDKPRFDRGASGEGAGERKSYGKPRSDAGGDRPRPSYGDKPRFDRGASGEGGGERKSYGRPRSDAGGDRPRPSYGDKPRGDRPAGGDDRPRKTYGDRPFNDKPRSEGGFKSARPSGGKPFGGKPSGGRPSGGRPSGGKPFGGKPPRDRG